MASKRIIEGKRRWLLSGGLLSFLVVYFLSLCTISPRVHADLLYQTARAHRTAAGHCALPSSARKPPGLLSSTQKSGTIPAQRSSTIPICCALVNMHKATTMSPIPIDILLILLSFSLPPKATVLVGEMQSPHISPVLHSCHSPPLYLLHTALLI